jgi:hypothetical protein
MLSRKLRGCSNYGMTHWKELPMNSQNGLRDIRQSAERAVPNNAHFLVPTNTLRKHDPTPH